MPSSFPPSLQHLVLEPLDWCSDLPGGLQELHGLETFDFNTECKSWHLTRPWVEFLPEETLREVALGNSEYLEVNSQCEANGSKGSFKDYHWQIYKSG